MLVQWTTEMHLFHIYKKWVLIFIKVTWEWNNNLYDRPVCLICLLQYVIYNSVKCARVMPCAFHSIAVSALPLSLRMKYVVNHILFIQFCVFCDNNNHYDNNWFLYSAFLVWNTTQSALQSIITHGHWIQYQSCTHSEPSQRASGQVPLQGCTHAKLSDK